MCYQLTMKDFQRELVSFLTSKYGEATHSNYGSREGVYYHKNYSVIYEDGVMFRIKIEFDKFTVDILDPKKGGFLEGMFSGIFNKLEKSKATEEQVLAYLQENKFKIKSTSQLKFIKSTDDYLFSFEEKNVICSLMEHKTYGTVVITAKNGNILDIKAIESFFQASIK